MKPRILSTVRLSFPLATAIAALLFQQSAQAQTWANSNITATPTAILDWFSGGPNTQATWTASAPVSSSTTTVQFFQDTATALLNTSVDGNTQTSNLNNGASAFELGTLTLSGRASATTGAFPQSGAALFEAIIGSDLQFSGATGTINLNAVNNTRVLSFQVANNIRLGTASSASALTLTGGGSGAFFISGNISELQAGGGSLTKSGGSLVTLTGNNTYTGATTVSGGTLRLGSLNALPGGIGATGGTSALTINGGIVELNNNDFLRNLGGGASQFQITGGTSGFSTKTGVRNLIVNNDATQEIQWGSASFNPTALVLNTANGDAFLTLQNKLDLNGVTRTINVDSTVVERGAAVISGVIRTLSGTAGLTKGGVGILKLHASNTFDGVVTINAGTLSINAIADGGNASPLGQSSAAAASLVLNGGTLRYTGIAATNDRSFTLNANAGIDASGSGALNLASTATPAYGAAGAARTLTLSGTNPGNNTLAAVLTNNGAGVVSVTKSGLGTWVLPAANTFTGVVTVSAGVLSIPSIDNVANANPLGQSANTAANLVLAGGTLRYTGASASSDRAFTLSGNSTINASGSGALNLTSTAALAYGTINTARTLTLSGTNTGDNKLSAPLANNGTGAITLAKAGQGKWILNGTAVNTYTGATQVNTGILELDFANLATPTNLISSTSVLTLGGGTLSVKGQNSFASSQTFGNPTFGSQAGSGISVTEGSGSTMVLTLGNTWTRNAGSTVNVTLGAGGTLTSAPAVDTSTPTPLVKGSGNIAFATVAGADWAKVSGGNVVSFVGGDYTAFVGDGTEGITANCSLTGTGLVTAAETMNTLKIATSGSGQSLDVTGQTLTLSAGGLLFTGADNYSITGGTLIGSGGTQKELVVHQFGAGNLTVDSTITNNSTATVLAKTGTGTLTLTAANTHTGNTYAGGGGTLVLKNQLALQSSALVINNSGIVFDSSVVGNAFTVGGLSSPYAGLGYDIALQNNAGSPAAVTLTVNQTAGDLTYAGVLSGTGSLIKTGGSNLTLSGINTYTGGTIINGGTLTPIANNDWGLGGGGPNGTVQVTVNTTGTLQLNSNNITGTLTLNGGTLSTGNSFSSIWSGSIILQSSSTFSGSNGVIFVPAVISGTGGLTKAGTTGGLALMNANTFSGDTKITGSLLLLGHSLALQNSTLDTTNSIVGTLTTGIKTTMHSLTLGGLSGNKNLSSLFSTDFGGSFNTNVNNPIVRTFGIPVGGFSGITALTLNPGIAATPSYTAIIADGAPGMSVIKTGLGTQTLSGANSYTGPTIVSAGTLALGANAVLPDVSAVTIGAGTLNAATFADTVGTLDVTGAATINLGAGAALAFANSSAVDWTGGTLNVTGTLGATSLRFGTTSGGLAPAQLALISVNGSGAGTYILDANGYLILGLSAYDTWKAANAPGSNPYDDTDGDGVTNAVEFVLGGTSATKDLDKLPVASTGVTDMTFTFKRAISSIDPKTALFIETSTDLVTWNTAPSPYTVPDVAIANNPGVTVVEDTPVGFDTVTLTVPKAPDAKKFARIKVIITP